MSNIRIIRTVRDAEEALSLLARRKYGQELTAIRRLAQNIANSRGGKTAREQAVRAVLIGFADNVKALELAS
ncbi:MAG: hypothetical protein L3J67_12285 [Hyphomicrobiaceae bacterium]|nr:hypothetical protein [Hyphomicrobiaceae bacterium]